RREAPRRFTWDCGFAQPTARMQYTGSAFVQPLVYLFAPLLRPLRNILAPKGLFPKKASYELSCRDGGEQLFWRPLMNFTVRLAIFSRRLQSGHLHLYVLLMILGLLALFIWGFAL
ncbi:MAG: hydrogenase, partial [Lentisphaeria bacterium]|nr:hydrogenase [Lentisphaeria bacterium]